MSLLLAKARYAACQKWPFASQAILSMVPVARPGMGTLAVDQHWRIYYDEAALAKMSVEVAAGVILHEVDHLLKRHHKRAANIVSDSPDCWRAWNLATDAAINEALRSEGVRLPDGVVYPESIGQPEGLSAEDYYRALTSKQESEGDDASEHDGQADDAEPGDSGGSDGGDESDGDASDHEDQAPSEAEGDGAGPDESGEGDDVPAEAGDGTGEGTGGDDGSDAGGEGGEGGNGGDGSGPADVHDGRGEGGDAGTDGHAGDGTGDPVDGTGSDGRPGVDGGSCSDGRQRPWELGEPDEENPGLDEADSEQVVRSVAESLRTRGTGSGSMKRWAEEVLNPAIDPAALLRHLVKQAVYLTSGVGERSYRRPSRRDYGPVVMPCNQAPVPKIAIIVDTSGSMDDGQLGLALGLIGRVVESYRITDGIQIVTGDEEGKTVAFTTDPSEVDLRGGGGTDMGAIVESVVDGDDPPHIVLVATDGDTPWPDSDVGVPVVCCLTSRPCGYYSCPEWIEVVKMYES
jgi:predicted metal-dependent peptidase